MRQREDQPKFIEPMLLTSGEPPEGDGWTYEIKWDGIRAQVRFDGRTVCLRSRPGRLCDEFPELGTIADALGHRRATLDGELVALRDDGRPDFVLLRQRLGRRPRNPHPVTFAIFDVLHLDGCSTRDLPYRQRRAILDDLALEGPYWRTPASLRLDDPHAFVRRVAALGLEGVVAKRLEGAYRPGRRSASWIKTKLRRDERLAVTGLRRTGEGRLEAVLVARPLPDGSMRPAGSIELGLRRDAIAQLEDSLAGLSSRRRGKVTWFPAEVSVVASCHGLPDGPVRDAVLRDVI